MLSKLLRGTNELDFSRERALQTVSRIYSLRIAKHIGTDVELHARAYGQFLGMLSERPLAQRLVRRLAALVLLAATIARNVLYALSYRYTERNPVDGVKFGGALREYEIPPDLKSDRVVMWDGGRSYLEWSLLNELIWSFISVGCFEPEVLYKCFDALAQTSGALRRFNARYALVYREFDFTSSVLTWYLRRHGLQTYNVMHGDKYYTARDSFFSCDRYYVWHPWYGKLACELRAQIGRAVSFTPERFAKRGGMPSVLCETLFVLPARPVDAREANGWLLAIEASKGVGGTMVRPHPRSSTNTKLLATIGQMPGIIWSRASEQDVTTAIRAVRRVIGYPSTVLIEAQAQGAEVVCVRDATLSEIEKYHPFFSSPSLATMTIDEVAIYFRGGSSGAAEASNGRQAAKGSAD